VGDDLGETRTELILCALVASVATAGSLCFSEVMGLYPCELCWFPRIAMYPLVVVFAVAADERRSGVWRTALPLSVGGGCENVQFELFGLLSIPNLKPSGAGSRSRPVPTVNQRSRSRVHSRASLGRDSSTRRPLARSA